MTETSDDPAGRERRLDEALGAYLVARDEGRGPDLGALLAAYPELAAFFADAGRLDAIAGPLRPAAAPATTLAHTGATVPASALAACVDPAASTIAVDPASRDEGQDGRWARGTAVRYLGDYELREVIGRGGMGVVWRAHQVSLNRPVALKMLRAGAGADSEELRRFRVEAEAAAGLDHPHIVPIFEVGEFQGESYFSMKLIDGDSLDHLLPRYAADLPAVAALTSTVARAVHHAHQRGVLHRDLKPANILVDRQGRPHVTDYGLAKRVQDDAGQTLSGAILGTAGYMSPEQAAGRVRSITTAADVYGLGAVLFAVLTGRAPFRGETVVETLQQVRERTPERPRSLNARVDRDLETICLKCLEKDPRRRYDSAAALADDLDRYLRREPILARRTGFWERIAMWARRHPATAALAGVSAVAALTLVALGVALAFHSRLQVAFAEAEKQTGLAVNALGREQRLLYQNRILFADRQLQENNTQRAEELLDACPPDRRDWEWHHLKHQCRAAILTIPAHTGWALSAAYSPDGRLIASSGLDGVVRLWDSLTGESLHKLPGHEESLACYLSFHPGGTRLASMSGWRNHAGRVLIHDVATGRELLNLPVEVGAHAGVSYSLDGESFVIASGETASEDGWVQVRDATTGLERLMIPVEGLETHFPSFSPDGKNIIAVVGSMNGFNASGKPTEVRVWDAESGSLKFSLRGHASPAMAAVYSPDGRKIATCGYDATVRVWDATDGREVTVYRNHRDCVNRVAFSPDSRRIASASDDGSARIWDAETGRDVLLLRGHRGPFFDLDFNPDGSRLVTSGNDGGVMTWDATAGRDVVNISAHSSSASSAAFSPDGRRLVTGGVDRKVKVWDVLSGQLLSTLEGPTEPVYEAAFSPDGTLIASAGGDWQRADRPGEVFLWEANTGRVLHVIRAHQGVAWNVTFSPDGRRLATGGGEYRTAGQEVIIWDTVTGQRVRSFSGLPGGVKDVAFTRDGRRLAAVAGSEIRIWDLETGRNVATLIGHEDIVKTLIFSPDGRTLFSGGNDQTIKVWDVATGAQVQQPFKGHRYWVLGFAISPDGRRIASAGGDRTVKLWDVATGQELISLNGHTGYVWSVAFSPDGRTLASADDHGVVKLWNGNPMEGVDP